jgi:origin recognition complex subunit 6
MSSQQPLHNLLPTTNPLPPRLVNLSASLLAQSRNRASILKPEEEIARSYACAEIACNRLRAQLRLPPTAGRPPCKPNVYKKLLGFLEGILGEAQVGTTSKTTTPKKRTANGQPKAVTPSTKASASAKKQAFAGTIDENVSDPNASEAPDFVMPLIRKLCKAFTTRLLPPHVYTGTCVVLKLSELWPPKRGSKGKAKDEVTFRGPVMMVTIGVYFMVLSRMQKGKVTPETFLRRLGKALEVAELDTTPEEVEEWIKKMNAEGWCRGQGWWDSVPEDVMDSEEAEAEQLVDDVEEEEVVASRVRRRKVLEGDAEEDADDVLLPGLGTMMQDSVDWLSEERKLHFLEWKDDIMRRINTMDNGKGRAVAVR